ncbi:hypothetical protein SAY87_024382 [Trapa incisa]|uniref:Selenoprotein O n=1 Tax=Trapa incisa TaxID=236973 RepID=A0AAN7GFU2_9MYRT|nr:hypothetical protein SAY87_024382 [Trapa incisa]
MDSPTPPQEASTASVESITLDLKNRGLDGDGDFNRARRLRLEDLNWDNSFVRELPGDPRTDALPREVLHACYSKVLPSAEVENPQLVAWSESVAERLDLDLKEFERPDFPLLFSGAVPLVGGLPYAQCYGGHQFGDWAGQLGDGRAISIGNNDQDVLDLTSNKYAAWAVEIAERTAYLIAKWQDLPGKRHCFANQPDIGSWNIAQFVLTLSIAELINDKEMNYAMERYGTKFMDEYQAIMARKLGLPKYNKQLISKLLNNMAVDKVDYTNFFQLLSNIKADINTPYEGLLVPLKALASSGVSDEDRKASMDTVNPKYVLRNYLCQSAIDAAEQGDFREVRTLLKLMSRPYDEQLEMQKYARLPPAWAYRPGVRMLSCSS